VTKMIKFVVRVVNPRNVTVKCLCSDFQEGANLSPRQGVADVRAADHITAKDANN